MTIRELLFQCDIESKDLFRKYEQLSKKIIESKWSIKFNEIFHFMNKVFLIKCEYIIDVSQCISIVIKFLT